MSDETLVDGRCLFNEVWLCGDITVRLADDKRVAPVISLLHSADLRKTVPNGGIVAQIFVANEECALRGRFIEPRRDLTPDFQPVVELVRLVHRQTVPSCVIESERPMIEPELVMRKPCHVGSDEWVGPLLRDEVVVLPQE